MNYTFHGIVFVRSLIQVFYIGVTTVIPTYEYGPEHQQIVHDKHNGKTSFGFTAHKILFIAPSS